MKNLLILVLLGMSLAACSRDGDNAGANPVFGGGTRQGGDVVLHGHNLGGN